ncbi:unnamed protein product, partial [Ectocarpus sp. 12 AP-2014]
HTRAVGGGTFFSIHIAALSQGMDRETEVWWFLTAAAAAAGALEGTSHGTLMPWSRAGFVATEGPTRAPSARCAASHTIGRGMENRKGARQDHGWGRLMAVCGTKTRHRSHASGRKPCRGAKAFP